jgi:hypothetical protein
MYLKLTQNLKSIPSIYANESAGLSKPEASVGIKNQACLERQNAC